MTVHHCPRCELRFARRGDLVEHLHHAHPSPGTRAGAEVRVFVPLDPVRPHAPVIDVASALAAAGAVLELACVEDGGIPPLVIDAFLAGNRDRLPGADAELSRLRGPDVVAALLARIARVRPDLVVLASHGRGPLGELLLGSISADLVRSSPSPTLLVGPACAPHARIGRLVVAVDGSADSLGALDVACHLAARLRLPLELVQVVEGGPGPGDVVESADLHRVADAVDPPIRSWDVLHGPDVARALLDHVAGVDGAVLVLGTHGRSPGRPRVLGGVAARTVRAAPGPVLVVSPEAASTVAAEELVVSGGRHRV